MWQHNNKQIDDAKLFAATNSYLGLCKHHKSYKVSRKIWGSVSDEFHEKYILDDYICHT